MMQATACSGRSHARTKKPREWSRNYTSFLIGVEGKYEFEAYGHLVRGRLVRDVDVRRQKVYYRFLPMEFWSLAKTHQLYRRTPENSVFIPHSRIRGVGPIYIPETVPIPDDLADQLLDMTQVIQATITNYSMAAVAEAA